MGPYKTAKSRPALMRRPRGAAGAARLRERKRRSREHKPERHRSHARSSLRLGIHPATYNGQTVWTARRGCFQAPFPLRIYAMPESTHFGVWAPRPPERTVYLVAHMASLLHGNTDPAGSLIFTDRPPMPPW